MLAYLTASVLHCWREKNTSEIRRLLAHPLAQDLPRRVREEAVAISRAGRRSFIAPVNALHLYYKLTHMVDEPATPRSRSHPLQDRTDKNSQLNLPLRKVSSR